MYACAPWPRESSPSRRGEPWGLGLWSVAKEKVPDGSGPQGRPKSRPQNSSPYLSISAPRTYCVQEVQLNQMLSPPSYIARNREFYSSQQLHRCSIPWKDVCYRFGKCRSPQRDLFDVRHRYLGQNWASHD
ncbi:uncharacterized protein LOC144306131 [Canis aureus]